MSAAVCPSCGVAVVPGYVKCPKCHKPLPRRKQTVVEGGTSVETSTKLPLIAVIAAAVLGVASITYLGLRSNDAPAKKPVAAEPTEAPDQAPVTEAPPTPVEGPSGPSGPSASTGPDPSTVADSLKRRLQREQLWSTVSVDNGRVDVRSASCSDPKMRSMLDASAASFKAAGLTRMRCLEQSGEVVSDRDL